MRSSCLTISASAPRWGQEFAVSSNVQIRNVVATLHVHASRGRSAWIAVEVTAADGSYRELTRVESGAGASSDVVVPVSFPVPPRSSYRFTRSGAAKVVEQVLSHSFSEM